jgi:histidinol dehydrogenase
VRAERRWVPLSSVGVYVPGGKAVLASSLVMAAVPAQVAGVERIAVVSPRPAAAVLATARELGLDEVYAVGGAQAVAALAYGTESIPAVDKIVGPGNAWVTAAKLLVASRVGIDLPAGPSEVLVVADDTADPELVAADLLAQAEHGPDSEAVLVTPSRALLDRVRELVRGSAQVRLELADDLEDALAHASAYAPEHLQLMLADNEAAAARFNDAGTVFLGDHAPAVLGDYAAGANHVLPTGGLARGAGGLGLESFLKPVQVVRATAEGLEGVRPIVDALARLEGLPLHAAAVTARANMLPR